MTCRSKRLPLLMLAAFFRAWAIMGRGDVDAHEVGLGGVKLQGGAWTHPDFQDLLVRLAIQIFEGLAAAGAQ